MRALDKLGMGEPDMIGCYVVVDDGSEDRWAEFGTVVKPPANPHPQRHLDVG
jgi:hypothetical protein